MTHFLLHPIAQSSLFSSFIICWLFSASSFSKVSRDFFLDYSQIPAQSPELSINTKSKFLSKGLYQQLGQGMKLWASKAGRWETRPQHTSENLKKIPPRAKGIWSVLAGLSLLESTVVFARDWEEEGMGSDCLWGTGFPFRVMKIF